ncbi:hypothetical protein [Amycolatopsis sp. Hca4]|uniref:hypothetical protein n=1 Tax=Amycolatopsis sp. Hca4 TaxID=2742131 RepID=UPI0020CABF6A|nr:hypothetical protein [Amycolatopsis sp. Hca4]
MAEHQRVPVAGDEQGDVAAAAGVARLAGEVRADPPAGQPRVAPAADGDDVVVGGERVQVQVELFLQGGDLESDVDVRRVEADRAVVLREGLVVAAVGDEVVGALVGVEELVRDLRAAPGGPVDVRADVGAARDDQCGHRVRRPVQHARPVRVFDHQRARSEPRDAHELQDQLVPARGVAGPDGAGDGERGGRLGEPDHLGDRLPPALRGVAGVLDDLEEVVGAAGAGDRRRGVEPGVVEEPLEGGGQLDGGVDLAVVAAFGPFVDEHPDVDLVGPVGRGLQPRPADEVQRQDGGDEHHGRLQHGPGDHGGDLRVPHERPRLEERQVGHDGEAGRDEPGRHRRQPPPDPVSRGQFRLVEATEPAPVHHRSPPGVRLLAERVHFVTARYPRARRSPGVPAGPSRLLHDPWCIFHRFPRHLVTPDGSG